MRASDVSHPEDEVKSEQEANAVKEVGDISEPELCGQNVEAQEKKQVASDEDAADEEEFEHMHRLTDSIVKEIEEEVTHLSESNSVKKEQIAKLELHLHRLLVGVQCENTFLMFEYFSKFIFQHSEKSEDQTTKDSDCMRFI